MAFLFWGLMPWIAVDVDLPDHPKLLDFHTTLGISKNEGLGYMVKFFLWARKYSPQGNITKWTSAQIASGCQWTGKVDDFQAALVSSGFIKDGWISSWDQFGGYEIAEKIRKNPKTYKKEYAEFIRHYIMRINAHKLPKNALTDSTDRQTVQPGSDMDLFWNAYPKKFKRGDVEKAWKQMKPILPPINQILEAVSREKDSDQWKKENGQFIPYPASWLRAKGWLNEQPKQERRFTG